ncbi:MAG: manganese efflux pump, partial [Oscillospiraceae bacterium]|nr:manganese efflux pump [Oscillospiraceae bacterium]
MDYSLGSVLLAAALSLSLSLDALAAAFAYGCSGIKIPFKSAVVINLVCTAILGTALFAGSYASHFISALIGRLLCFSVLIVIGTIKLYQALHKSPDDDDRSDNRVKQTHILKPVQAAIIAGALSIDGLAAGFGAGLGEVNGVVMIATSIAAHMAAIPLGCILGRKLSQKTKFNVSWIGGAVI